MHYFFRKMLRNVHVLTTLNFCYIAYRPSGSPLQPFSRQDNPLARERSAITWR